MEILRNILVIFHFIGIGALLGGFLTQMKQLKLGTAVINPAMFHGALTMLVTGILLVGVAEMGDGTVNHVKIAVKLAILIAIMVLIFVNRKKEKVATGVIGAIGALTIANIVIAVVW
ncbi:hypothetical protein [Lysinibacter sp. HNR]|uniref:hypothetical protein n=1 Tax=Lysinibacter sp. HNR TaxID=3031408 RepID=UPI002434E89B|nr:hypothetical protein [Lysinibacter sp. HNR]WGD36663.1 hypothetical protein FrondiHNR_09365 [Lysinibacter sp. HNR]